MPHREPSARCSPAGAGAWVRSRAATRPTGETTPRRAQRSRIRRICSVAIMRPLPPPCPNGRTLAPARAHALASRFRKRFESIVSAPRSGDHHDVEPGEVFGVVTEAFAYPALHPVARNRPADCPAGHRQPESWMVCPIGTQDECHDLRGSTGCRGTGPFRIPSAVATGVPAPEPPIGGLALRQRVCVVPSHAAH